MVEDITPEQLHAKLQAGEEVQVVDIRSPREFRDGHIPGAINVPFPEFSQRIDDQEWGDEIVVACPIGKSSKQAARLLSSFAGVPDGARIANLEGGYRDWEYELARGDDGPDGDDAAHEDAPF